MRNGSIRCRFRRRLRMLSPHGTGAGPWRCSKNARGVFWRKSWACLLRHDKWRGKPTMHKLLGHGRSLKEGLVKDADTEETQGLTRRGLANLCLRMQSYRDLKVPISALGPIISGFFLQLGTSVNETFSAWGLEKHPHPPILLPIFFRSLSGHLGLGDIRPDRNLKHAILMGTGFYGFLFLPSLVRNGTFLQQDVEEVICRPPPKEHGGRPPHYFLKQTMKYYMNGPSGSVPIRLNRIAKNSRDKLIHCLASTRLL